MKPNQRIENLQTKAIDGGQAAHEFKLLQEAFLEQKALIMEAFESQETLETEKLQDLHRKYGILCGLEDFFLERIRRGDEALNKLNSLQEKLND